MHGRFAAALVDLSSLVGLFIVCTGGLRTRHNPVLGDLNVTAYGPFFLPLALCLVFGHEPTGSRVLPLVKRCAAAIDNLQDRSRARWLALTIGVALAAHALVVFLRYYAFQTAMDLAIYANACHGALYSTMKGDVWLFADHFEPLLLLFTPLCRAFSPAVSLLAVQTLGWGVGALGIYALARLQGYRASLAWLCAMLYLNFSGHVTIAYYDFHLLALTLALVPWIWWAIAGRRYAWLAVLGLAYIGLKESAPLSIVGLGAYLVWTAGEDRKLRNLGIAFVVGAALVFALIMKVVYPAFRAGEGTMYFAKYYGHLGKDLPEFIKTALTRPLYFAGQLLTPAKLWYLCCLLLPFLFVPLRRPILLLPVLPAILVNVLSNNTTLISRTYHYEAEIFPALFAITVGAMPSRRVRAAWLAWLLVGFTSVSALGIARWTVPTPAQRRLASLLDKHVPRDRAVAAPQRIAAHLTDRPKLYMFDYWQMEDDWKRAEIVVTGFHGNWLGWYSWEMLETRKLPRMRPNLRELYRDPGDPTFQVFEVLPSAATAPSIASPTATAEDVGEVLPKRPKARAP
jgi:uncharacterized membrane protein